MTTRIEVLNKKGTNVGHTAARHRRWLHNSPDTFRSSRVSPKIIYLLSTLLSKSDDEAGENLKSKALFWSALQPYNIQRNNLMFFLNVYHSIDLF